MNFSRSMSLAVLLSLSSFADAAETYRFPGGVVGTGDGTGALLQRAGRPDRIVRLENRRGGAAGERWEYYLRDKQVSIVISGGRIQSIEDVR